METTDPKPKYILIDIARRQECAVILKLPTGRENITEAMIHDAVAQTVTPEEWDSGRIEIGKRHELEAEIAEELHVYEPFKNPTMVARAREIGITTVSLRKWRDKHGVDVFDDEAVRRHVGKQRNWNPSISSKFKPRLSGD